MKQNKSYSPQIQYIKYNPNVESYESVLKKDTSKKTESPTNDLKNEKINNFKARLNEFKKVSTLAEAKALLNRTIPIQLDRITLNITNDAKCIIINTENQLRICFDSPDEFISYDFV